MLTHVGGTVISSLKDLSSVSTAVKQLDSDPGIPNLLFLRKCSDGSASIYINCLE
jgi:hypothetical protein